MAQVLREDALKREHASPFELVSKSQKWRSWLSSNLSPTQSKELIDSWTFNARHNQIAPPGNWRIWALITGRAWGKNRASAEFIHDKAAQHPGLAGFLAGRTLADVSKSVLNHPKSGLLVTNRPENPCEVYGGQTPTKVVWANGAFADIHTSIEPDGARGPEYAWGCADEIGTWKRVVDFQGNTTWDNLQFGLRGGPHPQMVAGSTPRPVAAIRDLLEKGRAGHPSIALTTGTMYDNIANLPASFIEYIEDKYKGTRLFRQEALGELLLDLEDAILTTDMLDAARVDEAPEMQRILVSVDPALTSHKKSDKTGICVPGLGIDGDLYCLADRSCKLSPDGWSRRVVDTYHEFEADAVVAETNVLGDAVATLIHAHPDGRDIRVINRTARKRKHKRAEPILAWHERGKAHIVGNQPDLEDQLVQFTPTGWNGEGSPDNADAYVWGATELTQVHETSWDDMIAINA